MLGCSFPHFVFGKVYYDDVNAVCLLFCVEQKTQDTATWPWFSGLLPNYHSMDGWLLNVENKV